MSKMGQWIVRQQETTGEDTGPDDCDADYENWRASLDPNPEDC